MVAMIPPLAAAVVNEEAIDRSLVTDKMFADYLRRHGLGGTEDMVAAGILRGTPGQRRLLVGVTGLDRVRRLCQTLFDPAEFLSPHGLRSLSAYHRDHPYVLDVEGVRAGIDYEPAESTTAHVRRQLELAGSGVVSAELPRRDRAGALPRILRRRADDRIPAGSGTSVTLDVVAADLWERLVSLFLVDRDGCRPCFGGAQRLQTDPRWRNNLLFYEYFHGDNGAGLGASHQTGWTGLVADVIRRRHRAYPAVSEVIQRLVRVRRPDEPEILPGRPAPLGATWGPDGTNFAVSSGGDQVTLCLFDAGGAETRLVLPERDGDIWHGFVPGVGRAGLRFSSQRTLRSRARPALQPGQAAPGPVCPRDRRWVRFGPELLDHATDDPAAPSPLDSAGHMPRSLVMPRRHRPCPARGTRSPTRSSTRCTSADSPPRIPTCRPSCAAPTPGWRTRRRWTTSSVSALPPSSCCPSTTTCPSRSSSQRGLTNYWGYNTIGFFAPHAAYSAAVRAGRRGGQVEEFRSMVDALHAARLEVVLDVVFNHTAEGGPDGPTLCHRGLDNPAYYRLDPGDPGRYLDTTGCGNSVNTGHPVALR